MGTWPATWRAAFRSSTSKPDPALSCCRRLSEPEQVYVVEEAAGAAQRAHCNAPEDPDWHPDHLTVPAPKRLRVVLLAQHQACEESRAQTALQPSQPGGVGENSIPTLGRPFLCQWRFGTRCSESNTLPQGSCLLAYSEKGAELQLAEARARPPQEQVSEQASETAMERGQRAEG